MFKFHILKRTNPFRTTHKHQGPGPKDVSPSSLPAFQPRSSLMPPAQNLANPPHPPLPTHSVTPPGPSVLVLGLSLPHPLSHQGQGPSLLRAAQFPPVSVPEGERGTDPAPCPFVAGLYRHAPSVSGPAGSSPTQPPSTEACGAQVCFACRLGGAQPPCCSRCPHPCSSPSSTRTPPRAPGPPAQTCSGSCACWPPPLPRSAPQPASCVTVDNPVSPMQWGV